MAGNRGYASAIVVWTVLLVGIVTALQFWGRKSGLTTKSKGGPYRRQSLNANPQYRKILMYALSWPGHGANDLPFAWMLLTSFKSAVSVPDPPPSCPNGG